MSNAKELAAYERGLRDGYERALQKFCEILDQAAAEIKLTELEKMPVNEVVQ